MDSDYGAALREISREEEPIRPRTVALLSSPTRGQRDLFVEWFGRLSVTRRRELVAAMVANAEEFIELDFSALYRPLLKHEDAEVRRLAIDGLWEDDRADLADALAKMVASDPDKDVRAAAAISLGRFVLLAECEELDASRGAMVRAALESTIARRDEDLEVVRRAVEAIAYINDTSVRRIIDRAYESPDERMRQSALLAMGRNGEALWTDAVLAELESKSPAMRYEAARSAGELELQEAVGPLLALTEDLDHEVQNMSIWALGQIGGERARRALECLARSDDPDIAEAAEAALGEAELATGSLDLFRFDPNEAELAVSEPMDEPDDADGLEDTDDTAQADWPDELLDE